MRKAQLGLGLALLLVACGGTPSPTSAPAGQLEPWSPAVVTPLPSPTTDLIATRPEIGTETRVRAADGMMMVHIPDGDFLMGAAEHDAEGEPIEKPQHTVFLEAFWIDRMEVSNQQYRLCVEAGACQAPTTCDFGQVAFDDGTRLHHPVVCVTWHDAQSYCQWASGQLPTEAQWEKAARGTDGRIYPWGDTIDCSRGNVDDEVHVDAYVVPGGRGCDGYEGTAPVGSYPRGASPYGVLDMAGNVWEWVRDWRDWEYYDRSPSHNPQGPAAGDLKIVRGGSWHYGYRFMRATTRHSAPPEHRADALGFRCVTQE